jgi:hypothetical protein
LQGFLLQGHIACQEKAAQKIHILRILTRRDVHDLPIYATVSLLREAMHFQAGC